MDKTIENGEIRSIIIGYSTYNSENVYDSANIHLLIIF